MKGDKKIMILFFAGFALCVFGLYTYMTKETNDYSKLLERLSNTELDSKKLREDHDQLRVFHNDMLTRVLALEKPKEHFPQPLQIEVIRKPAPTIPIKKAGRGKNALLDRAGIHARERN